MRKLCIKNKGFTLIELMIVVAVIAILAAIAMPSYEEYVRRGHRASARAALLTDAQWMERAATAKGSYPLTADFPASLANVEGSDRYTIALVSDGASFTLTATPQGTQAGDKCGSFTVDQTGLRANTGLNSGATTTDCWSR